MLESELQKQVIDYLRFNGFFVYKNNVSGVKTKWGIVKNSTSGIADLTCIKQSKILMIECKQQGKYQKPIQREFEKNWTEHGGSYYVVRNIDDVEQIIKESTL